MSNRIPSEAIGKSLPDVWCVLKRRCKDRIRDKLNAAEKVSAITYGVWMSLWISVGGEWVNAHRGCHIQIPAMCVALVVVEGQEETRSYKIVPIKVILPDQVWVTRTRPALENYLFCMMVLRCLIALPVLPSRNCLFPSSVGRNHVPFMIPKLWGSLNTKLSTQTRRTGRKDLALNRSLIFRLKGNSKTLKSPSRLIEAPRCFDFVFDPVAREIFDRSLLVVLIVLADRVLITW